MVKKECCATIMRSVNTLDLVNTNAFVMMGSSEMEEIVNVSDDFDLFRNSLL